MVQYCINSAVEAMGSHVDDSKCGYRTYEVPTVPVVVLLAATSDSSKLFLTTTDSYTTPTCPS